MIKFKPKSTTRKEQHKKVYESFTMDCFGFCGEKCAKKKKKSKEKYKEERNGVPIPLQEETQFPESAGDGQEMGTIPETLLQPSPETGDLSPHCAGDSASCKVMQVSDEMPCISRTGQNEVKQTSQFTHEVKKETTHKPKHRHYHDTQETSDSDTDSSSDSTSDESPSADDSFDSPAERRQSSKTKKKSKSVIIKSTGGIVDFGKHNTNKIVNIQYGGQNKKGKNKDRSSKSHKKDLKLHMDQERGQLDLPGHFHKICDETDTISNMEMIVEVAKSVGIIRSPRVQGTGFRVGDSYIMTALHVVEGIINPAIQPLSHGEGRTNWKLLGDRKVHIDFDYKLPADLSQEGQAVNTLKFSFEPQIFYQNECLDTAVLKLKNSSFDFPRKLTRFCHCHGNLPMYFIGHSNDQVKTFDKTKPKYVSDSEIMEYQTLSKQHHIGHREKYRGYGGAADPRKILFDCSTTFNKGASGSPGFIISSHDKMPYVVSMLLRGYPDWYYDEEVKEEMRLQSQYTFEQGVRITEVYQDMKAKNPGLCSEIFGTGT